MDNLCTNPGFEVDTSGWITSQATLTRDTTEAYEGVASGKIITNGVGDDNRAEFRANATPSAGELMVGWCWVKGTAGQQFSISTIARDSSLLYIGTFVPQFYFCDGNWNRVQYTRVAPSGVAQVCFSIGGIDMGTTVVTIFIDSVVLGVATETQTLYVPRRAYVRR